MFLSLKKVIGRFEKTKFSLIINSFQMYSLMQKNLTRRYTFFRLKWEIFSLEVSQQVTSFFFNNTVVLFWGILKNKGVIYLFLVIVNLITKCI